MVGPSPPTETGKTKAQLRAHFRLLRRKHVAAQPQTMRSLLFMRPPAPIVRLIPDGACIGLYHPLGNEAPTLSYARWLHENGRQIALPWFANQTAPMTFRVWTDPYDEELLEAGPFGITQPRADAPQVVPDVVFVPLIAFTADGSRLGQGGGHYDRWLAAHPDTLATGLAWDCQLADTLPVEPHDQRLAGIVTPTRFYEGTP